MRFAQAPCFSLGLLTAYIMVIPTLKKIIDCNQTPAKLVPVLIVLVRSQIHLAFQQIGFVDTFKQLKDLGIALHKVESKQMLTDFLHFLLNCSQILLFCSFSEQACPFFQTNQINR